MNAGTPLRLVVLAVTLAIICTTGVHSQEVDLVFVIDASGSISVPEWGLAMAYFRVVVEFFDMDLGARFGAVTFNHEATIGFQLDQYFTHADVVEGLKGLINTHGRTSIAKGLAKGKQVLDESGRSGVAQILFLFSDGHDNEDKLQAEPIAISIAGQGIDIICVGIRSSQTDEDRLETLASNSAWVEIIPTFEDLFIYHSATVELIQRAMSGVDHCRRCKDYNDDNYGYIAANTTDNTCYWYYVCRLNPETGFSEKLHLMQCPIGTQFAHYGAIRGNPCVTKDKFNTGPCEDHRTPDVVPIILTCPYTTSTSDPSEFGFRDGSGGLLNIQSCGAGGYFDDNDGVCACTIHTSDCLCLIWIDFTGNFTSHSCHGGWVGNRVPQVHLIDDGVFGQGGEFGGLDFDQKKGAHLTTHVIDGIFSPTCDGQFGQHQLTVALWFNYQYAGDDDNKTSGLVNHCDGPAVPAFYIEIRGDLVCAGLKTVNHIIGELCSKTTILKNHWYYTALVYDDPYLYLYVTDVDDYVSCSYLPPLIPGPTCFPAITNQTGCVESRTCGFDVGVTGRSWKDNQFFTGLIDEVQVTKKARYHACR